MSCLAFPPCVSVHPLLWPNSPLWVSRACLFSSAAVTAITLRHGWHMPNKVLSGIQLTTCLQDVQHYRLAFASVALEARVCRKTKQICVALFLWLCSVSLLPARSWRYQMATAPLSHPKGAAAARRATPLPPSSLPPTPPVQWLTPVSERRALLLADWLSLRGCVRPVLMSVMHRHIHQTTSMEISWEMCMYMCMWRVFF